MSKEKPKPDQHPAKDNPNEHGEIPRTATTVMMTKKILIKINSLVRLLPRCQGQQIALLPVLS
ncbi:hypothetical protein [Erwinia sp. MYb535]|uniref:hypothetical protein n=1 Tax=Erwinia sp. MYb535 TaxID=2745309 RepID=UPI0030AD9DA5